jgi:excisionase family DNA binding protein
MMTSRATGPELLTPKQAADILQVNRGTIYRYIRDHRLFASKVGRSYRIPKLSIELFVWANRTYDGVQLREYTSEEIAQFLKDDELTGEALEIAKRIDKAWSLGWWRGEDSE